MGAADNGAACTAGCPTARASTSTALPPTARRTGPQLSIHVLPGQVLPGAYETDISPGAMSGQAVNQQSWNVRSASGAAARWPRPAAGPGPGSRPATAAPP